MQNQCLMLFTITSPVVLKQSMVNLSKPFFLTFEPVTQLPITDIVQLFWKVLGNIDLEESSDTTECNSRLFPKFSNHVWNYLFGLDSICKSQGTWDPEINWLLTLYHSCKTAVYEITRYRDT